MLSSVIFFTYIAKEKILKKIDYNSNYYEKYALIFCVYLIIILFIITYSNFLLVINRHIYIFQKNWLIQKIDTFYTAIFSFSNSLETIHNV